MEVTRCFILHNSWEESAALIAGQLNRRTQCSRCFAGNEYAHVTTTRRIQCRFATSPFMPAAEPNRHWFSSELLLTPFHYIVATPSSIMICCAILYQRQFFFFFPNSGQYVAYTPDSRNDKRVFDPLSNCCMAFCLNDAYLTDHTRLVTFPELISCQRQAPLRPAKGLVKPCRLCKNGP